MVIYNGPKPTNQIFTFKDPNFDIKIQSCNDLMNIRNIKIWTSVNFRFDFNEISSFQPTIYKFSFNLPAEMLQEQLCWAYLKEPFPVQKLGSWLQTYICLEFLRTKLEVHSQQKLQPQRYFHPSRRPFDIHLTCFGCFLSLQHYSMRFLAQKSIGM